MFNLQGGEIVIILLLALVVLGPEKLPEAMRKMGQFYAELRKMSSGFQQEFRDAVEEPVREMRDTANTLRDSADFTKLQDGEREEKPKSAQMADVDPVPEPVEEIPTFDTSPAPDDAPAATPDVASDGAVADGPALSADSQPAPFDPAPASEPSTDPNVDQPPTP